MKRDSKYLRKKFSEILRKELEEQGVTQRQLAEALVLNISSINNAVNGRANVSFDIMSDICNYLNIEIGYRVNAQERQSA